MPTRPNGILQKYTHSSTVLLCTAVELKNSIVRVALISYSYQYKYLLLQSATNSSRQNAQEKLSCTNSVSPDETAQASSLRRNTTKQHTMTPRALAGIAWAGYRTAQIYLVCVSGRGLCNGTKGKDLKSPRYSTRRTRISNTVSLPTAL